MKTITSQVSIKEDTLTFPHWKNVAGSYPEAVLMVLKEIADSRPFCNYIEDSINPKYFRETDRKKEMIEKVTKGGMVTLKVQLGEKYRGKSVQEARRLFQENEFGLGVYEVACALLAKPEILKSYDDLWIDCAGDEYSSVAGVRFGRTPLFDFVGGRLWFDAGWFADARGGCGSASGLVPQSLEPRNLDSIESAIKIVKESGYKVIKEI